MNQKRFRLENLRMDGTGCGKNTCLKTTEKNLKEERKCLSTYIEQYFMTSKITSSEREWIKREKLMKIVFVHPCFLIYYSA